MNIVWTNGKTAAFIAKAIESALSAKCRLSFKESGSCLVHSEFVSVRAAASFVEDFSHSFSSWQIDPGVCGAGMFGKAPGGFFG